MSHVTSLTLKKKISLEEWDTHLCLLSKTNSRAILWQPSDQNSVLTAKGAGLILGRGTKIPEPHGSTETKKKAKKKKQKTKTNHPKVQRYKLLWHWRRQHEWTHPIGKYVSEESTEGIPWWSSGYESMLWLLRVQVSFLVTELRSHEPRQKKKRIQWGADM